VAYQFEVLGWEDWEGDQHWGVPLDTDLPEVAGTFSRFWDEDTGDEHHQWVYIDYPYDDWDDWWDLIAGAIEDHGYSLA